MYALSVVVTILFAVIACDHVCVLIVQSTERFCNEDFDVFLKRTSIQRSDLWDETVVGDHTENLLLFSVLNKYLSES